MAVNLREKEAAEILTVDGAQVFIGQAGVKKPDHNDLTLIVLNKANSVGAVFTQNRFCAAPVHIAKQHLTNENGIRALVINTGNANAGTGAQGREDALAVCAAVAAQVGCDIEQVLPFSTGVILEPLPAQKITRALPGVKAAHWSDAARAIMTTDTVPKAASREAKIGQKPHRARHRHCQRCRHDPPEYGHHARLYRYRCQSVAAGAANDHTGNRRFIV